MFQVFYSCNCYKISQHGRKRNVTLGLMLLKLKYNKFPCLLMSFIFRKSPISVRFGPCITNNRKHSSLVCKNDNLMPKSVIIVSSLANYSPIPTTSLKKRFISLFSLQGLCAQLFIFFANYELVQISQSVCHGQAFPAQCNVRSSYWAHL